VPQMILNEVVSVRDLWDYQVKVDAMIGKYDAFVEAFEKGRMINEIMGKEQTRYDNLPIRPRFSSHHEAVCFFGVRRQPAKDGGTELWRLRSELWFWTGDRVLELVDIAYYPTFEAAERDSHIESLARLETWEQAIRKSLEQVRQ